MTGSIISASMKRLMKVEEAAVVLKDHDGIGIGRKDRNPFCIFQLQSSTVEFA